MTRLETAIASGIQANGGRKNNEEGMYCILGGGGPLVGVSCSNEQPAQLLKPSLQKDNRSNLGSDIVETECALTQPIGELSRAEYDATHTLMPHPLCVLCLELACHHAVRLRIQLEDAIQVSDPEKCFLKFNVVCQRSSSGMRPK